MNTIDFLSNIDENKRKKWEEAAARKNKHWIYVLYLLKKECSLITTVCRMLDLSQPHPEILFCFTSFRVSVFILPAIFMHWNLVFRGDEAPKQRNIIDEYDVIIALDESIKEIEKELSIVSFCDRISFLSHRISLFPRLLSSSQ